MVKRHTAISITRLLADTGYVLLALLMLQALALAVMCVWQYVLYSQPAATIAPTDIKNMDTLNTITHDIATLLPSRTQSNSSNIISIGTAIAALCIVICLLLVYLAKITAAIVYSLLRASGRPTFTRLFILKTALAGGAMVVVTIGSLTLPATILLIPLGIGLFALFLAASLLEYSLAIRAKLPVTKALGSSSKHKK